MSPESLFSQFGAPIGLLLFAGGWFIVYLLKEAKMSQAEARKSEREWSERYMALQDKRLADALEANRQILALSHTTESTLEALTIKLGLKNG